MATAAKCHLDTNYFFQQLASAEKRFLILDFDSTIARLDSSSASRFPYPQVNDLLECIAVSAHTRLIVASALPIRELQPLLAFSDAEVWGHDGLERSVPSAFGNRAPSIPLSIHTQAIADRRRSLIDQRCARYPLAYLVGSAARADDREFFVAPELHIDNAQVLMAAPEPLVQFLADWLRVCAGEIC